VQARTPAAHGEFQSAANPYPIYAWPRTVFWLASIAAAALVWTIAVRPFSPA
jgi:hypothetical protein